MIPTPHTASADSAQATAAWNASPADLATLDARVMTDEAGTASNSPRACLSLPATTSAWLDGLLTARA